MLPADLHLETRYHYTRLNENEKRLYVFWVELFLKEQFDFIYTYTDKLKDDEEPAGLPVFRYDMYATEDFISEPAVLSAIQDDWPELYYITSSCYDFFPHNVMSITRGRDDYTSEEIAELNARLDEILHSFDHIEDDFELEVAVHDYITREFDYDYGVDTYDEKRKRECFTVAGMLKYGCGVCAAFAALMQFVLQRRGIPVVNLTGDAGAPGDVDLHAWLAVKIKGNYYHLDITFNEGRTKNPEFPQYMFFNVTDEEIRADHVFNYDDYPGIVCSCTDYNYFRGRGLYFTTEEEITAAVQKFVNDNIDCPDNLYYYFRVPTDFEEKSIRSALREAMRRVDGKITIGYLDEGGYYALEIFTRNNPHVDDV